MFKITGDPIDYSAGGLVVNNRGQILFVQEYGYYWGLPRGRIERGETAAQAAIREIEEETGLKLLEPMRDLGTYERSTFDKDGQPDNKKMKNIRIFLFCIDHETPQPKDKAITNAKWVKPAEAISMLINDVDKQFLSNCLTDSLVVKQLQEKRLVL